MNVYAESSAVLAWLLGEERAPAVIDCLGGANLVVSSDLTLVECDRTLLRCAAQGALDEASRAELAARAATAAAHWTLFAVSEPILTRARLPFPDGPVRTLDAIHLASALEGRAAVPDLAILALDERVRRASRALGFGVFPAHARTR